MTRTFTFRALGALVLCLLSLPLFAQEGEGALKDLPPKGVTVDELIQRFASKEKEFKLAREQYTWTQSVKVQTLEGNAVDGEYQQVFDVVFDERGRRSEQIKFAPQDTLTRIQMTQEDLDDIEKRMPFTMTIDERPRSRQAQEGPAKPLPALHHLARADRRKILVPHLHQGG